MNLISHKRFSSFLSVVTIAPLAAGIVIANSVTAIAQTVNSRDANALVSVNAAPASSQQLEATPVPGTTATSSAALQPKAPATNSEVAQLDVDPGQATRGGSSYIGVAGNLGLSDSGNTAVGDGNFMIISKIGLTDRVSTRPSVVLGDNTTFLIPVTYDFSLRQPGAIAEPLPIAPYLGGGLVVSTGDDSDIGLLVSGGVDVPLTSQLTATAAVNAAFVDDTDVGLMLGIGYNFSGLGL